MSDHVLRTLGTPSPDWRRAVATALSVLARQPDPAEPAKHQLGHDGMDQIARPEANGRRSDHPGRRSGGTGTFLRTLWRRYRSRQRIALLDAHALRDIGVSFAEAEAEANKPFWRR